MFNINRYGERNPVFTPVKIIDSFHQMKRGRTSVSLTSDKQSVGGAEPVLFL